MPRVFSTKGLHTSQGRTEIAFGMLSTWHEPRVDDADSFHMQDLKEIALLLQRPVQQLRYIRVEWRKKLFIVLQSVEKKKVVRALPLTKPPKNWVTVDESADTGSVVSTLEKLDLKNPSYIVRPSAFEADKPTI